MSGLPERWTRLGEHAAADLVLAVDFDGSGRKEATFRDLARLLPKHLDVWHAVPPPYRPDATVEASHFLDWWADLPQPGRVHSILGYCAGSVFASRLADRIESRQGMRPTVVLFNPGSPSVSTLNRDFRPIVDSLTILTKEERATLHRRADETLAQRGDDFDAVSAEFVAMYLEASDKAFERYGIDPDVGQQLTRLFRSYLSYLSAARQVVRDSRWASAISLNSREHAGPRFTETERSFDLSRAELLNSSEVVATVCDLLAVRT
jgi:dienelactone hydrolase